MTLDEEPALRLHAAFGTTRVAEKRISGGPAETGAGVRGSAAGEVKTDLATPV